MAEIAIKFAYKLRQFVDVLWTLANSRLVWAGLILSAVYWLIAYVVPINEFIILLDFLMISVGIALVISFSPNVYEALQDKKFDRISQLTLGIAIGASSDIFNYGWNAIIRLFDLQELRYSAFVGYYIFLAFVAAVLHLTAPGAIGGKVPRKNWLIVGTSVGVAVMVFLVEFVYLK